MSSILDELCEIGKLIDSANLLNAVRTEVHSVFEHKEAVVIGGKQSKMNQGFDVVVRLDYDRDSSQVIRRLKANVPDVEVSKLVNNVLGIKHTRRGK